MKTIDESVLTAMDCTDVEILPYLPYILQDFWGIGSEPEVMITLIKKHHTSKNQIKVLDLGCGKGFVSVNIAKQLNCKCYGIDAIPEFIDFSKTKANEFGVSHLCTFEVGDIREKIKTIGKYDVIILGAIGQVFGNYFETLSLLKNNLNNGSIIIIDDGYSENKNDISNEKILTKRELHIQISEAGMQIIDEVLANEGDNIENSYDTQYNNLLIRCQELSEKYPQKAEIFINYSNQQKIEYNSLKNDIICSTMVIKIKS